MAMKTLAETEQGRKQCRDEAFEPSDSDEETIADNSTYDNELLDTTQSRKRHRMAKATNNPSYNAAAGPIKDVFGELASVVNRAEADAVESSNRLAEEANQIQRERLEVEKQMLANMLSMNGMFLTRAFFHIKLTAS